MTIRRLTISLWMILVSMAIFAEQKIQLPDIAKPSQLTVIDNHIYITEGASIFIYSLKDYHLIKKFGSAGEGPGEFKLNPFGPGLQVFSTGSGLVVNSDGRISYFTLDGTFVSEKRVKPYSLFIPIDDHFVGNASEADKDNRMWLQLNLYNGKPEKVKTLHRTDKTIGTGLYSNLLFDTITLPYRSLVYPVYKHKVYIPIEKEEGIDIQVFDAKGNPQDTIRIPSVSKLKVTDQYKEKLKHWFRDLSPLKPFWERIKGNIRFTSHFPPYKNLLIYNDHLYLLTHFIDSGKNQCLVLDMKGKQLHRLFLALPPEEPFAPVCYTIKDNRFYALHENPDTETWELHVTSLNLK